MGRTIYTSKRTLTLRGAYICSKCNNINYFDHKITERVSDSRYGAFHSKKRQNLYSEEVSKKSQTALQQRIFQIFAEAKDRKFRSADYKGRCKFCKNREPWQRMHYKAIDDIIYERILPMGIMFCLLLLLFGEWRALLILLGVLSLPIALYNIVKKNNIKKREAEIALMKDESLPILFLNEKELLDYMKVHDRSTLEDVLRKKMEEEQRRKEEEQRRKEEDKYDLCPICGAIIKPGQQVCHVCGTEQNCEDS